MFATPVVFLQQKMKRKKTWNKSKYREFVCGYCTWCKKELLNTMGGWIITAKKQYFCHDGKDGSCFDLYCNIKLEQQENNEKRLSQNKVR